MTFLALLTGLGSIANFMALNNKYYGFEIGLAIQIILLIVTIIAAVSFKGKKTRPAYFQFFVRHFTVRFVIVFLSLVGNLSMILVIGLQLSGRNMFFQ
ncbi:hypothetical protein [Mycoplasma sp. P36-A1]|uniref:hypothetical protein n=1 Tax=Mycoplasma sp. P36-A1 TaxID=3252900 RepID=UPI003C30CB14